jgi:hypothetical protein
VGVIEDVVEEDVVPTEVEVLTEDEEVNVGEDLIEEALEVAGGEPMAGA